MVNDRESNFSVIMHTVLFSVLLIVLYTTLYFVEATSMPDYETSLFNPSEFDNLYDMPESCVSEGTNYCFKKGKDYPQDKIEKLIADMNLIAENLVGTPSPARFIDHRLSFGNEFEENDCAANYTTDPVYYILDENDRVRVVVQSKNFSQEYNMHWCLNEGRITSGTRHFMKNTVESSHIECVNTWMDVDFFVLNEDDPSQLRLEIVRVKGGIPVYCRCRVNSKEK